MSMHEKMMLNSCSLGDRVGCAWNAAAADQSNVFKTVVCERERLAAAAVSAAACASALSPACRERHTDAEGETGSHACHSIVSIIHELPPSPILISFSQALAPSRPVSLPASRSVCRSACCSGSLSRPASQRRRAGTILNTTPNTQMLNPKPEILTPTPYTLHPPTP